MSALSCHTRATATPNVIPRHQCPPQSLPGQPRSPPNPCRPIHSVEWPALGRCQTGGHQQGFDHHHGPYLRHTAAVILRSARRSTGHRSPIRAITTRETGRGFSTLRCEQQHLGVRYWLPLQATGGVSLSSVPQGHANAWILIKQPGLSQGERSHTQIRSNT